MEERRMQTVTIYIDEGVIRLAEPQPAQAPAVSREVRRNRERVQRISAPYMLFLATALALCMVACVSFLQVQSSIAAHRNSIESLKTDLEELKTDNDSMEILLSSYTDLEYIEQVATEELGMVYPSDGQIIYYEKTESGYVRQYEDIPTE